jgi:hypothetical protein
MVKPYIAAALRRSCRAAAKGRRTAAKARSDTVRRQIFLDHGRAMIEYPRLTSLRSSLTS